MECPFKGWDSFQRYLRTSTSVDVKSWKIQKVLHFTHFDQKNTYIIECKIVHKCTSATVTIHICTVTVSLAFILLFFLSPPHTLFFSLVWLSPAALFSSTELHCSLESRHSCATADHLTRSCSHRSPPCPWSPLLSLIVIAIFFLCLMVLGF